MPAETTIEPNALPVACSLGVGDLAQRSDDLRRGLFASVVERRELPDGFAYRFPATDDTRDQLLAFAATERTCCAFFQIELAFEPSLGPIWLTLRGPDGVKEFVERTFEATALTSELADSAEPAKDDVPTIPTIGREELKAMLDQGEPILLIEALPEMYYRRAHLPGAINLTADRLNELAPTVLPDRDAAIVVYCADLACPSSHLVAERLLGLGYTNVRDYAAGKQDWMAAGYPTERAQSARAA